MKISNPQVRLGVVELENLWSSSSAHKVSTALLSIQDAILAAQPNAPKTEPVDVPFDYKEWSKGGWQVEAYNPSLGNWYDTQYISSGASYRMRRKT